MKSRPATAAARSGSPGRGLLAGAIAFGLLALLLGALGLDEALTSLALWRSAVRVDGVVVRQEIKDFEDSDGQRSRMTSAIVRYEVAGRAYEIPQTVASGSSANFPVGGHLQVLYDPAKPEAGRIATTPELVFLPGLSLLLCAACGAGSYVCFALYRGSAYSSGSKQARPG